jgi:hypothetical protein
MRQRIPFVVPTMTPPLSFVALEVVLIFVAASLLFISWRRQSYRFGLRWLLLSFGVAACALFVLMQHAVPTATHRWAIRRITNSGGQVIFYDSANAQYMSEESRRRLQQQAWRRVLTLSLSDDAAAIEAAAHFEFLPEVRSVYLGQNVSDTGLQEFCDAARDRSLDSLGLLGSSITTAGLSDLAKLERLPMLFIHDGAVDDNGLAQLKLIPGLKSLWLLEQVDIGKPDRFTPKGFAEIGKLNRLESLQLHGLKITDSAARQLHGLSRLQCLMLDQCEISDAALDDLRAALPTCNVSPSNYAEHSETE